MVPETPNNHLIAVRGSSSAIGGVCENVLSELTAGNYSQDDIFAVHLALEEALINAIKHGNKMNSDKGIKIDYSVDKKKVEISLTDEGNGFDPESVPDPRCDENLYKTEGRGIFLMRSYMDVVEFNEKGNCVHMVKYKQKPSGAD